MMQFSESAPAPQLHPPPGATTLGLCLDLPTSTTKPRPPRPWPPSFPSAPAAAKSLGTLNTAACMEQLLVHCADAIESGDATMAHQLLWVLNTIAPPDGDSTQRLTSAFLRSLVSRLHSHGGAHPSPSPSLSALDLAAFVDLTPLHRFGFSAANSAISELADTLPSLHLVDLTTTHCMQIPTLIDSLAARRPDTGPPFHLLLTVPGPAAASPPPALDLPYPELGRRLAAFARSRNVSMDFRVVPSDPSDGFHSLLDALRLAGSSSNEPLVVNCQMTLHYIPDEVRPVFLERLRGLEPALVTVSDEDADFTAGDVAARLRAAYNYLWIAYDAVEAFLPRGSERRQWYEAGVCWRVENVVAREGRGRVERPEPRGRWARRFRGAGFRAAGVGDEAAAEVRGLLDEHAAGWGMKREEDDLVLTWKGHNVVFAAAWVPSS